MARKISQEDDSPSLTGKKLNDELFRSAVATLRQEPTAAWKMQAELLLGHPVVFAPDWDSLLGQYELIQPFVHVAIAGTLEALVKIRFDPAYAAGLGGIERIVVRACPPNQREIRAERSGAVLIVYVPPSGSRPATEAIATAMRGAIGHARQGTIPH